MAVPPSATGWYNPDTQVLASAAFAPHKENDKTGLSVYRGKYRSVEQAAVGRAGKWYFIAKLRAADLKANEILAIRKPLPNDPGHAELPELNSSNRSSDDMLVKEQILVRLVDSVVGPFLTPLA